MVMVADDGLVVLAPQDVVEVVDFKMLSNQLITGSKTTRSYQL